MNENAIRALRIAIVCLFCVYVAPLVALAWSYFSTDQFDKPNWILTVFSGLVLTGDDSLSLVHRALLPLMAGFAPLAFRDDSSANWSRFLMIVLICAIGLSIFLSALFTSPASQTAFYEQGIFIPIDTQEAAKPAALSTGISLAKAFFDRTQESMSMYLLLLFGLTLSKGVPA